MPTFDLAGQPSGAAHIVRGVARLMRANGIYSLQEMTLSNARRADLIGIGADGEISIVEIKSSLADFRSDRKWQEYRPYCDRFYFATHPELSPEIFPSDCGLIIADGFGGQLARQAPCHRLSAARRKAVLIRFARYAARRQHDLMDPGAMENS